MNAIHCHISRGLSVSAEFSSRTFHELVDYNNYCTKSLILLRRLLTLEGCVVTEQRECRHFVLALTLEFVRNVSLIASWNLMCKCQFFLSFLPTHVKRCFFFLFSFLTSWFVICSLLLLSIPWLHEYPTVFRFCITPLI